MADNAFFIVELVALGVVGFLALMGAAFNGARSVGTGQNGASFAMAAAWAAALLCYLSILFLAARTGPVRRQS